MPIQSPLLGFRRPACWCVSALCGWWYLAWVWFEGRRRRRPPLFSLSLLRRQASLANVFFSASGLLLHSGFLPLIFKPGVCCRHWSLVDFFSWCPSLLPPPPSPFPRTTVRFPPPSLRTEEYLRGLSLVRIPLAPAFLSASWRRSPSVSSPPRILLRT